MIRSHAALALLALGLSLGTATAQETPATPAPEIVIDPAAALDNTPRQANMLTGFYATQAVIDICAITLDPGVVAGMAADRTRLETSLGLDAAAGVKAYDVVKADVEKTTPDCTDGSTDRLGVDAVTAIYLANAAAPAAPAPSATPASPAEPAAPVAPAP